MPEDSIHPAVRLLSDRKVPMRAAEFVAGGVSRTALSRLAAEGRIERIGNGLYRLPDETDAFADWAAIAMRYPKAVIGTLSAAVLHGTTQEMPGAVHVLLPKEQGIASLASSLPVMTKVIRLAASGDADPFSFGIEERTIAGVAVKVTDPERTLVDMFRFSSFNASMLPAAMHVSEEAVLDCMERTLARKGFSVERLDRYVAATGVGRHFRTLQKSAMHAMSGMPSGDESVPGYR